MVSRRQVLATTGLAGATAGLGLSGCGGGSDSDAIRLWSFYGEPFGDILTKALDGFTAETDIKVEHRVIPFDEFNQTLLRSASAGKLPDIALISAFDTGTFAEAGILTDLSDRVDDWGESDQYFEASWATTQYDGKTYGLPHACDCYVLWYNTDHISAPPSTWEELVELAVEKDFDAQYGLAASGIKGPEGSTAFIVRLLGSEGDIGQVDDDAGKAALRDWVDLVDGNGMSAEFLTMTEDDVKDRFAAGEAAMMINSASYVNILSDEHADLNWKVAVMPADSASATMLAQENLTITSGATDVDRAWKLLTYLQQDDVLGEYLPERNKLPTRQDIAEQPPWSEDEVWQVFMEQLGEAWAPTGELAQNSNEIFTHIQQAIQSAVSGETSIDEALETAQSSIEKSLDG